VCVWAAMNICLGSECDRDSSLTMAMCGGECEGEASKWKCLKPQCSYMHVYISLLFKFSLLSGGGSSGGREEKSVCSQIWHHRKTSWRWWICVCGGRKESVCMCVENEGRAASTERLSAIEHTARGRRHISIHNLSQPLSCTKACLEIWIERAVWEWGKRKEGGRMRHVCHYSKRGKANTIIPKITFNYCLRSDLIYATPRSESKRQRRDELVTCWCRLSCLYFRRTEKGSEGENPARLTFNIRSFSPTLC
jgi:hypothetical protein